MRWQIASLTLLLLMSFAAYAEQKKTFYDNGALHFEYDYVGEQLDGITKEYYEAGQKKAELIYEKGNLKLHREFLPDGRTKSELWFEQGEKHEISFEYYSSGTLFLERNLINGQFAGLEKEYYPDGVLKAERHYQAGKRHGNAKGYHDNGNLQGDWQFENGLPVAATIYYRTGEKWLEHTFKQGKLNGITKEYDKEGRLIAERHYRDDTLTDRKIVTDWF